MKINELVKLSDIPVIDLVDKKGGKIVRIFAGRIDILSDTIKNTEVLKIQIDEELDDKKKASPEGLALTLVIDI